MTTQRKALTKLMVEKAMPEAGRDLFIWDARIPGFGIRIYPSGKRLYVFQYRTKARQQRRVAIGLHGPLTVDKAREMAADLYEAVRKGGDPAAEQKAAERIPDTIEAVVAEFMQRYMIGKERAPRYIDDTQRRFDKHVLPRWRGRDIKSITRRDVIELLDQIVDEGKPIAANRTLTAVRKLFNWALQRGIVDTTPTAVIEKPGAERKRERIISADELHVVWLTAKELAYPFGHFFLMALATGQRREEIATMRWQDIDEGERIWTLSSNQTKAARVHVVPLSPLAMELLGQAKETAVALFGEQPAYVFTTLGNRPISGYSKAKARLDAGICRARKAEGSPDLPPWTIHDLRRTVATGMGRLGISRFVIARMLNHADRSVTGIYDRYEYLTEKRHALEAWGRYVGEVVNPSPAKVVPLRAAAE